MSAGPINVSIVEENPGTGESLMELLARAKSLRCAGVHRTGEEALRRMPAEHPDVVLMDVNLRGMSGTECVAHIKDQSPKTKILMLSTYEESDLIFDALRSGASGYVLKNMAPLELVRAIEEVHAGGAPMSMHVARKILTYFQQIKQPASETEKLTKQEREILRLIGKGYPYEEIADQLGASVGSLQAHLRAVYEKLHEQSRANGASVGRGTGREPAAPDKTQANKVLPL